MSIFHLAKGTKMLIAIMVIITLIGLLTAKLYYTSVNDAEDPRIIEAKKLYVKYKDFVNENNHDAVLATLDSIQKIYSKYPDYKNSYEIGTLQNDKAAVFLTRAIYDTTNVERKNEMLAIAAEYLNNGIQIYVNWLDSCKTLSENEIRNVLIDRYRTNEFLVSEKNVEKIIKKRIDDILMAQIETPRRLSVSYTNLAIIKRHQLKHTEAIDLYQKALDLWEDNYTAQNNQNILLGKPVKERGIIEKLFPPEKVKNNDNQ